MKKLECERKIKHWQGYGSVNAKVVEKSDDMLVIQVSGEHEYGLDCDKYDIDRVYEWLVKRFDPTKKVSDIESVDVDDRYEGDMEVCDYIIHFRNRMWQESGATLKDIERGYGKKVADALVKYCALKKLDMNEVVSDLKTDGNGMTPWDKFDVWAQNTLDLDIMDNFDDTYDWSGAEERERKERERAEQEKEDELAFKKGLKEIEKNRKDLKKLRRNLRKKNKKTRRFGQVYHAPTDFSTMDESSGSRMEDVDVLDWIFQEMRDCEWVEDIKYVDSANAFEVSMPGPDGDVFKVSVTKIWSGRLGERLD